VATRIACRRIREYQILGSSGQYRYRGQTHLDAEWAAADIVEDESHQRQQRQRLRTRAATVLTHVMHTRVQEAQRSEDVLVT